MSAELFKQVVNKVQNEIYFDGMSERLTKAREKLKVPHEDSACDCDLCQAIDLISGVIKDLDILRNAELCPNGRKES